MPQCMLGYPPPGSRHPTQQTPREQTPPESRHPHTPFSRAKTPRVQTPGIKPPPEHTPPRADTVNERPIRILLECILVKVLNSEEDITHVRTVPRMFCTQNYLKTRMLFSRKRTIRETQRSQKHLKLVH